MQQLAQDSAFMAQAIELAKKGRFTVAPNPAVGCLLVKGDEIVGQGFHVKAGEPHAEAMALRQAGDKARGATAYVTLEPCAHYGRTPPCALALIQAGVKRVVAAMQDPNPQVAGKGLALLREAGIETAVGVLTQEAEALNKGFLKRMRSGLPFVRLKMAVSIDGKTAMASGESKWITGEAARADVQRERALSAAILSTGSTVAADNPGLNVRWAQLPVEVRAEYPLPALRQPLRIIMDSQSRVCPQHNLFQHREPVWLIGEAERDISAFPDFCRHLTLAPDAGQSKLQALMVELGRRKINDLWVEAGAVFAGALIEQNLVDELILYIAPKLLGHQARDLCVLPHLQKLADAPLWHLHSMTRIDEDLKLVYTLRNA